MRSGKSHCTLPSGVKCSCPATDASPLILMIVGAHHWVMVVIKRPKQAFVKDM